MAKKTIQELMQEAKAIKIAMQELKQKNIEAKKALAVEYCDNLPEVEKQKQIAEAEKILNTAKQELLKAKENYKKEVKRIKESFSYAKEILDFVNYKSKNSLPKTKNSFVIEKNTLTFNREGIKEIKIDVSKANWQQVFKQELKLQGINGENRIADNIIYKATQLLKSNITI